jgi:tetratricopeptide (TPR) repeat protein
MNFDTELAEQVQKMRAVRRLADSMASTAMDDPQAQLALARAYSTTGDHASSLRHLERAAELEPSNPGTTYNLGVARQYAGAFQAAAQSFRRATQLAPENYRPYAALVMLEKQTPETNFIPRLEALFRGPDPDGLRTLSVGHALAKTYEDLGELPKSFEWLGRAKAIRGQLSPYSFEEENRLFDAAAAAGDAPDEDRRGYESSEPIFVVGLPRTGTTLVDRILSSHPDVMSAGELHLFFKLMLAITGSGVINDQMLHKVRHIDLSKLGRAYIDSSRPLTGHAPHFIDKAPINVVAAGVILRALPNARIVCLKRDPMDAVLSNFRQMFDTPSQLYNYVYSLENTAKHYINFSRLTALWRERLSADRYMEVRYEDLVDDQKAQTRRLLAFCGLDWDDRCLAFHENASAVSTPSSVQVRSPVYRTAIGRWRRYGDLMEPAREILSQAGIIIDADVASAS